MKWTSSSIGKHPTRILVQSRPTTTNRGRNTPTFKSFNLMHRVQPRPISRRVEMRLTCHLLLQISLLSSLHFFNTKNYEKSHCNRQTRLSSSHIWLHFDHLTSFQNRWCLTVSYLFRRRFLTQVQYKPSKSSPHPPTSILCAYQCVSARLCACFCVSLVNTFFISFSHCASKTSKRSALFWNLCVSFIFLFFARVFEKLSD